MKGSKAFHQFFQKQYGSRWPTLFAQLNPKRSDPYSLSENLIKPYYLDYASYLAAKQLPINPSDKVLDACAAPGGKALIIATQLDSTGSLVVNEYSHYRFHRLKQILQTHLPENLLSYIQFSQQDACVWPHSSHLLFDKILLDVPCSSEAYQKDNPRWNQWKPQVIYNAAEKALAIAYKSLSMLKPGGKALYCTCSLAAEENHLVIEKLLYLYPHKLVVLPLSHPYLEPCPRGYQILPDQQGWGPLYFCLLEKLEH